MMPWRACVLIAVAFGCGPSAGDAQSDEASGSASSGSSIDTSAGPGSATTTTNADATSSPASTSTSSSDDGLSSEAGGPDFMTCVAATCSGTIWSCYDGDDDDGDGLVDLADPECTGICDDEESSFQTQLPGDQSFGNGCNQDCQFDGNSGQGDDGCLHRTTCDPEEPAIHFSCHYSADSCPSRFPPLTDECVTFCEPFVLPGCDCFGCCTIPTSDGPRDVFLEGHNECSMSNPDPCTSCTSRIDECGNTCDECEICIGGVQRDACRVNACDVGDPCISDSDCACGEVCQLGCCWPLPPG
jgi:hypothetical protein